MCGGHWWQLPWQRRCKRDPSRLKTSLSVCPVMDVSSCESSCGGKCLYLSVRMFLLLLSPLHSSHVSVTEVCPAARPHVKRILSLSINWSLNPHILNPYLQSQLHNSTRISGLQEVFYPHILILLSSLLSISQDTHFLLTRHILDAHKIRYPHKTKAAV